jgi:hypothetical protein
LGFNRLQRLRELERDLVSGCTKEALVKVQIDIQVQTHVLHSIYKEHKNSNVMEGVFKRDPAFKAQLEKMGDKRRDSWIEPKCK